MTEEKLKHGAALRQRRDGLRHHLCGGILDDVQSGPLTLSISGAIAMMSKEAETTVRQIIYADLKSQLEKVEKEFAEL